MIDRITIKERGPTPRGMRKAFNGASSISWYRTGRHFHEQMRDERFTAEHGRKAGYTPRKGEEPGISGRAFWRSYTGQKLRKWRHKRPLEWSGRTRRAIRTANISHTSKGSRVKYPGARTFNLRNPHSSINMADEFRRLLAGEIVALAQVYEDSLDSELKLDNTATSHQV